MTMSPLEGKLALVTGAGEGLGREIVRALLGKGARVVANDIDGDKLKVLEREIGENGSTIQADVSVENQVVNMYKQVGRPDLVVCNAGLGLNKPLIDTTIVDFDRLVGVNLRGVYLSTREALKMMSEGGEGTIVNVSSGMLRVPGYAGLGVYGMSKSGIENFTQCAAREYQHTGIKLFTVLPGRMDTVLHRNMFPSYSPARLLNPKLIAGKIVNLAEGARYLESGVSFDFFK